MYKISTYKSRKLRKIIPFDVIRKVILPFMAETNEDIRQKRKYLLNRIIPHLKTSPIRTLHFNCKKDCDEAVRIIRNPDNKWETQWKDKWFQYLSHQCCDGKGMCLNSKANVLDYKFKYPLLLPI